MISPDAPQGASAIDDEVVGMHVSARLRQHEAHAGGLVYKCRSTEIALLSTRKPAFPRGLPGRPLAGRWSASA